jgi:endonuclease YncB( thermonuclease family)
VRIGDRLFPLLLGVIGSLDASVISAQQDSLRGNVRDVTPPGIMRVYGVPGEANAIATESRRFDNVSVLADGRIRSGTITISLYGVTMPARDKLCRTPVGARWACGVSAIGALRNMLQARSIICLVQDAIEGDQDRIIGSCRLGHTDIALRLLEQGWATPDELVQERRYVEAAHLGRNKQLGLWSSGPRYQSLARLSERGRIMAQGLDRL